MVKCTKCGKDSTDYAALVRTAVRCTSQGCSGGYKKCNSCIWHNGYMIKCCSSAECAGSGKRKCIVCNGTGKTYAQVACTETHRRPTTPPYGRS